jgi:hypothetical protein
VRRAGAVAALALVFVPVAKASNATPAQVAALAARAGSDPQALAGLRQVDRIDGRPVDLAAALDANGPELAARLSALSRSSVPTGRAAADPRGRAQTILAERRFRGSSVPRPLHRPLQWLGGKLRRLYDSITGSLPGGDAPFWLVVSAVIVAAAAFVAGSLGRRREGRLLETGAARSRGRGEDPARLEREAAKAERDGDLERALRLRFRAGLIRLVQKRALPERIALTNGEIDRRLGSQAFRGLARDFDEVIYGRRAAEAAHVDRARSGWPRVLEEAAAS